VTGTWSRQMLELAGRSKRHLQGRAELVGDFALARMNPDGGFRGRSAASDLYYTAFGVDCVLAMGRTPPAERLAEYLRGFGDGEGLDLIHLAALARCLSRLPGRGADAGPPESICRRIESFRRADGGYATSVSPRHGSAYGCFLAASAYQDVGAEAPRLSEMSGCLEGLKTADGAYANQPGLAAGTTTATAAAVVLGTPLPVGSDRAAVEWLLAQHQPEGGFLATPAAPIPDLLSTAAALYALTAAGEPLDSVSRPCLDFVESLWDEQGAFCGSWADPTADCEYTFHALLAIGCVVHS